MKLIVVDGCFGTTTEIKGTKLEHLTFEEKKEVLDKLLLVYEEELNDILTYLIRGHGEIIYSDKCDTCEDWNAKYELNL